MLLFAMRTSSLSPNQFLLYWDKLGIIFARKSYKQSHHNDVRSNPNSASLGMGIEVASRFLSLLTAK